MGLNNKTNTFVSNNDTNSLIEDKKIDSLEKIGEEQISKNENKISTDYEYDVSATRIHFTTFGDSMGRGLIIFSQLAAIVSIFLPLGSLSAVLTQIIPFSPELDILAPYIWKLLTVIFAIIGVLSTLLFLIPAILVKNIRSLTIWSIVFLVFGNIFNIILVLVNILNFLFSDVPGTIVGVVSSCLGLILFLLGSLILLTTAKKYRENLEMTISNSIRKTSITQIPQIN
ncbi:hypothetical protein [Spiroplasma endosymbiont of Amphibalanus improvisus]|uniref:hypothetical protein n=1 Tax=Spiroplasma endosymbiont of Amphibalanus improvisus TaxID=3066327 RepID=UPI00313E9A54